MRIMRHLTRRGPVYIADKLGLQASTVGRVLRRHGVSLLRELDPVTGTVIRASRRSTRRYEHDHPGSLIHVDVKKLGRIPGGGGWRLHGRGQCPASKRGLGYDDVHTVIDDHSRVAYAEIHDDEKGVTAAGVLERAQPQCAGLVPTATNGVPPIVPPLLASAAALSIVIVSVLSMMRVLPWQRRLG